MKILHINQHDVAGGAAKAAHRLHMGLNASGHDSKLVADQKRSSDSNIESLAKNRPWWPIVSKSLYYAERALSLQCVLGRPNGILDHSWLRASDVVNLHNIHGSYFSLSQLRELSSKKPLVWTLHDMWSFTGHCSYSYECSRWQESCGECPILGEYPPLLFDTTKFHWKFKKKVYDDIQCVIVTPTNWLRDMVRKSPLLKRFDTHVIPYGLDLEVFKSVNKAMARQKLNLPPDEPVVLYGAAHFYDHRKGHAYFSDAMQRFVANCSIRPNVVMFGSDSGKIQLPNSCKVWRFDQIEGDGNMAAIYAAADVFVCPSLADNLPNTVLESLACGVPVVAFPTGGIPEAISHLQTGFLAKYKDSGDLAKGITLLLTDDKLRAELSAKCRLKAVDDYSVGVETLRYVQVYNEALQKYSRFQN